MVKVWIEPPGGDFDGEHHDGGEIVLLDERQAWELQRRRKVRIATFEETAAVERADQLIAAHGGALPRLALDMPL
ncbi:MAG TPA: hypothetical protein VEF89_13050 [Solirubrobacteraceae bacterium]|nr:hypothetical protein [Solirubrobacteraceae bacterium]